jgi:hypothetical protein
MPTAETSKGARENVRRATHGLLTIGLVLFLIGPGVAGVSADEHFDQFDAVDMVEMIFYPFVPHGEMIDGTGPWYGSITIQNVEQHDVKIWAFTDAGFDPDNALGTYVLAPGGAITLSASALGLEEPGAPVVIAAVFRAVWEADEADRIDQTEAICDVPSSSAGAANVWVYTCKPSIAGVVRMATPELMAGPTGNRTTPAHLVVDGYNAVPAQDVSWGSQSEFCAAVWGGFVDLCNGIGTYEPLGYGVGFVFDGHSYLPIVQTNSGWNTVLHISNIDPSVWSGQVNVTLIASIQQGHAASAEHKIAFERNLRPGESWVLDLKAEGIPDEWVGSAHITSNVGVVANASRIKPEANMLMTNVSAPSLLASTSLGTEEQTQFSSFTDVNLDYQFVGQEEFEMYGPLVFLDYNGWNTGISIANIGEMTNTITATFYSPSGSVIGVDQRTVAPQGQEYIYLPARQNLDLSEGWVGSVVLSAPFAFHATIDQVKYSTGEAMSYMATAAGARSVPSGNPWPDADFLALPLFQKGQLDGSGDTSGIQLFNSSADGPVDVEIEFRSQVGNLIAPTQGAPVQVTIPPRGNYTVYSMSLSEMAPNTAGTVIVRVVGGAGHLVGVSNTVNYAVDGDGSTAFNLVNTFGQYRFPVSQTAPLTTP